MLEDGVQQTLAQSYLIYGGREMSVQVLSAPTAAPEGMILPPTRPVADVLAIPLGTFKSRLNRATVALRAALEADERAAVVAEEGIA